MPALKAESHWNDQVLYGVTGDLCLTCSETITLVVCLRIRHGASLVLRNIELKVAKKSVSTPIIGRRVLESLRCDNHEMLTAMRDKYCEYIDVASRLAADGNEETGEGVENIAALFGEPIYS